MAFNLKSSTSVSVETSNDDLSLSVNSSILPSKTSDLTNDSDFITEAEVLEIIGTLNDTLQARLEGAI